MAKELIPRSKLHLSFRFLTQSHLPFKNLLGPPASFFSRLVLLEPPHPLEARCVTASPRPRACAVEPPGQLTETGGGLICKGLDQSRHVAVTSAPAPRVFGSVGPPFFGTCNRSLPTPEGVGETSCCVRRSESQGLRNAGTMSPETEGQAASAAD